MKLAHIADIRLDEGQHRTTNNFFLIKNILVLRVQNCFFCEIEKHKEFEKCTTKKSLVICIKRNGVFLRFMRLLSHTQGVPPLRTLLSPPLMTFPRNCSICPKSEREIMLFIVKPKGRSRMISNFPSTPRQPSCYTS